MYFFLDRDGFQWLFLCRGVPFLSGVPAPGERFASDSPPSDPSVAAPTLPAWRLAVTWPPYRAGKHRNVAEIVRKEDSSYQIGVSRRWTRLDRIAKLVPMRRGDLRAAFGLRIRLLRVERRWSQEMLAERSGLDRTYIGSIERGERNVGLVSIGDLAEAFSVSLPELFGGVKWEPRQRRRLGDDRRP